MESIKHFLLVFDHSKDQLINIDEFGTDVQAATQRYNELERQYRHDLYMDIVLVGSDSIDTVQITHSNYFEGTAATKRNGALRKLAFA